MSVWLSNTLERAEQVQDWLSPRRQASLALLREAKWPTRKTEAWKYTSVKMLADASFLPQASDASVTVDAIEGLNSIDLLFLDGKLLTALTELPDGLTVNTLNEISESEKGWVLDKFAAIKPQRHLFGLVNDVLATAGVVIDVAEDADIKQPIRLVHRFTAGHETHTRVLVRLEANSKAVVIEDFAGAEKSFNTGVTEFEVEEQAELEHYRLALQTGEALSVGGSHFNLQTKSKLNSTLVGFGSELSRLDVDVTHAGEFAEAKMNAIYLLDGEEMFDLHSTIEHAMPNGTTEENVRGIVADHSRAVFNGRIHIHRGAQKTLAELNNRNLLLSRNAEVNTKPELEIYADDVRCAHGATIAEIDKKALYYLRSRGVDLQQAQIMLSFGFINELVDLMPNQVLAEWLRPQLRERFSQMKVQ